jgi:hypothetical protein
MVDHERTLAHRKKLPTGKSEPVAGPSSAQSYSSFPLHRRSITMRPENFFPDTLFLNYMSARDLEQFDKHLKLRCPWIFEPSLAGFTDAL